jgi:hypothetical protein
MYCGYPECANQTAGRLADDLHRSIADVLASHCHSHVDFTDKHQQQMAAFEAMVIFQQFFDSRYWKSSVTESVLQIKLEYISTVDTRVLIRIAECKNFVTQMPLPVFDALARELSLRHEWAENLVLAREKIRDAFDAKLSLMKKELTYRQDEEWNTTINPHLPPEDEALYISAFANALSADVDLKKKKQALSFLGKLLEQAEASVVSAGQVRPIQHDHSL